MTEEQQLKLQAFFDGELPEKEAREVAAWVAREGDANDLLLELRNTRKALGDFEPATRVPESREFYWSKIQRSIDRLEPIVDAPAPGSILAGLRRLLIPAGAVAAALFVGVIAGIQVRHAAVPGRPQTEMTTADPGTFTYQDDSSGTTLVWVDYPAESEFAHSQTR